MNRIEVKDGDKLDNLSKEQKDAVKNKPSKLFTETVELISKLNNSLYGVKDKEIIKQEELDRMPDEDMHEIRTVANRLSERLLVEAYDIIDDVLQKKYGRRMHQ